MNQKHAVEPQQSHLYETYMHSLKWSVHHIGKTQVFLKQFPIIGGIIKVHRPISLPDVSEIRALVKQKKIRTLVIEPALDQDIQELHSWCKSVSNFVAISRSPFLPTKSIRIDLTRPESDIFSSFSEAKRRAVRRSIKLGVTVYVSNSIRDMLAIKNASAGLFGFMTTSGIYELWNTFAPENASILLAHDKHKKIIGGVLLIHYDRISYYWIAGTIKYGKKLFAPTLLVWECIRHSKKLGLTTLDFVGVWDERLPKENLQWLGFTKFKEGFGGKEIYYPLIPHHI